MGEMKFNKYQKWDAWSSDVALKLQQSPSLEPLWKLPRPFQSDVFKQTFNHASWKHSTWKKILYNRALCSCMQNWVYRSGFAAQGKNYKSWNLLPQNILLLATSAVLIHKFEQLALVMSQQSYMHKNYYRHFIKIYETQIHKNTLQSVILKQRKSAGGKWASKLEHH